MAVGAIAGVLCAMAVGLKYKFGYDDSLDVVGVHLVGGIIGSILVGFFATGGVQSDAAGLFYGGGVEQLGKQIVGVVAVLAPQKSSFLGLVSVIAPVIATGNTAVVIASADAPLPALSLGEVLATSDVPGGVVNILSGATAELAAPLAAHQDVNAIDLTGAGAELAKELEIAAADNLKRVLRPLPAEADGSDASTDWLAAPGTHRLTAFLETKTVWHPTGALGAAGSSY
ncbi:hypothetical protein DDE05_49775 [Streptomyces cavourensis]|nr:hypothetical protein DDE05_49775 [Streptomyces cavourensis]